MTLGDQKRRTLLLALLLAVVTFVSFAPVLRNDFIRYDDRVYVTDNPRVLSGLTLQNMGWAFSTGYASNWHPVTWLSHMVDVELFGLWPGGHHLTSLALHILNALILFLLLHQMTGTHWRSWIVAALFALHPLRVESVAWVAERKDVLSSFFLFLTLWAYTRYAQGAGGKPQRYYWTAVFCFALGLMSKPMLVTTPFLLLLLDFWPLKRISPEHPGEWVSKLKMLVREKVPLFVLAAISSIVTYLVQEGAQALPLALPLGARLANAIASYWKYLGKLVWPDNLTVFYPHPDTNYPQSDQWPWWGIAIAASALLLITAVAFLRARKMPWFTTGWFWYLGTLVPVIGLVQVGRQAMADRYTYIPMIGIHILIVWALGHLATLRPRFKTIFSAVTPIVLALLAVNSTRELQYWRNNLSLFERALQVNPKNATAHTMVGIEHGERGAYESAIHHFQQAIEFAPSDAEPHFGLGYTYQLLKQPQAALEQYRTAVQLNPLEPNYHHRLGEFLQVMGAREEALKHLSRAVELNPDFWQARLDLGLALAEGGDLARAEAQFAVSARLASFSSEPLLRLAENLMQQGRLREAEARFRQLVRLYPENPDHYINLGGILWFMGRHYEALDVYTQAVVRKPDYAVARYNLGITLLALEKFEEAAAQFAEAVRLDPEHAQALTGWGRALNRMGRHEEALNLLEQSLALRPDGFTWQQIAQVRLAQNQPHQAIAALNEALKVRPEWPPALDDLARLYAMHPDSSIRDPSMALELAQEAVRLTGTNQVEYLATLDMAYAQNERFQEAIAIAEKARTLSLAAGLQDLAAAAEDRLKSYQERRPYAPAPFPNQ